MEMTLDQFRAYFDAHSDEDKLRLLDDLTDRAALSMNVDAVSAGLQDAALDLAYEIIDRGDDVEAYADIIVPQPPGWVNAKYWADHKERREWHLRRTDEMLAKQGGK